MAIDPALRKIEQVLLWKNKLNTCAIFTFCHFLFWIFQNFNIRTYCIISSVCLTLHILDAYRAKKRREIYLLRQAQSNIIDNVSALGRYIIVVCDYVRLVRSKLSKLKQRNRLQYFLLLLLFWSMSAVIGVKIRGVYLVYLSFWMVFFVPPVLYYDVPRKMLCKALPLLEQLDHSMKYQRRSMLDKRELLVDVKIPHNDLIDEEIENEYLQSFKLSDLNELKEKDRKVFENLQDDEDDDEDDDVQQHMDDRHLDSETEESIPSQRQQQQLVDDESSDELYDRRIQHQKDRRQAQKSSSSSYSGSQHRQARLLQDDTETDEDGLNSFLPDDSLPNISDVVNDYYPSAVNRKSKQDIEAEEEEARRRYGHMAPASGADRVLRKRPKNRPSLLDYYDQQGSPKSSRRLNDRDIDETFDFLDEYNDEK